MAPPRKAICPAPAEHPRPEAANRDTHWPASGRRTVHSPAKFWILNSYLLHNHTLPPNCMYTVATWTPAGVLPSGW
jgi:hypothetical protein